MAHVITYPNKTRKNCEQTPPKIGAERIPAEKYDGRPWGYAGPDVSYYLCEKMIYVTYLSEGRNRG